MTTRRAFLASSVMTLGMLAGCTGQSAPNTESITRDDTTATTMTGTSTSTNGETTTTRATDTTNEPSMHDPPELNRTPYPVAWEWDMSNRALGEEIKPLAVLLKTDDWQDMVNVDVLSEESRSFLSETNFESESVAAFQTRATARLNRLILHSVDGVGTSTITLTISEWESGSGQLSSPPHLLLVRVPNRGTEPTDVKIVGPRTTTAG